MCRFRIFLCRRRVAANALRPGPPKICQIDAIASFANNDAMIYFFMFCWYDAFHKGEQNFIKILKAT